MTTLRLVVAVALAVLLALFVGCNGTIGPLRAERDGGTLDVIAPCTVGPVGCEVAVLVERTATGEIVTVCITVGAEAPVCARGGR